MIKILRVETFKYLKSPTLVGYLVSPIIYFTLVYLLLDPAVALTFTIFTQTLFMALFVYGTKVGDYSNETMKKKVKNSNLSMYQVYIVQYLLCNVILILSLLIPLVITVINVDSLSSFEQNQFTFWAENDFWVNASNNDEIMNLFTKQYGINFIGNSNNLLLFNSFSTDEGAALFFSWIFALLIVNISLFSFAHMMTTLLTDSSKYFSLALSLFILILLFSSTTNKDVLMLNNQEAYGRVIPVIKNKTLNTLKLINPFYWVNQLLMNATIADWGSGQFIFKGDENMTPELLAQLEGVNAPGIYVASYFNIFHVGTNPEMIGTVDNLNRPAILEGIELWQLSSLILPIVFTATCTTCAVIKEVL